MPDLLGKAIHHAFHRELRLVRAKAPERPANGVVGPHRQRLDVDRREDVRTGRVPGRALEHLHPHRRVRPGIADHARLQAR